MTRDEALKLVSENIFNQNLIKHCLAAEAIMKALARHFHEDEERWRLVGLLHDIDYKRTKENLAEHSLIGAQMLKDWGFGSDICEAVKRHNESHGIAPETLMEKAIFSADPLTGLITASALILPSKKLADVKIESIMKRFGEKRFAAGANREIIKKAEENLNLTLEEFIRIGLEAMQGIADELGL